LTGLVVPPAGDVGVARLKELEQELMGTIGHGTIQEIMRGMMKGEMGAAEWEETGMSYASFARSIGKSLGLSEDVVKTQVLEKITFGLIYIANIVKKSGVLYRNLIKLITMNESIMFPSQSINI